MVKPLKIKTLLAMLLYLPNEVFCFFQHVNNADMGMAEHISRSQNTIFLKYRHSL
jgi:hypothetical protein